MSYGGWEGEGYRRSLSGIRLYDPTAEEHLTETEETIGVGIGGVSALAIGGTTGAALMMGVLNAADHHVWVLLLMLPVVGTALAVGLVSFMLARNVCARVARRTRRTPWYWPVLLLAALPSVAVATWAVVALG